MTPESSYIVRDPLGSHGPHGRAAAETVEPRTQVATRAIAPVRRWSRIRGLSGTDRPGAGETSFGQTAEALHDLMLGTLDQRYDVQDQIGQGGMAIVYRSFDRKLRREVAIKVLRPELTASKEVVQAFHREAAATSKLSPPNIVSIHDFGELDDGRLFMVIEMLRGQSLTTILEAQREAGTLMPWRRIVNIGVQVCAALTAAHACGITHHDITPGNIFCLEGEGIREDHVKVLDFGIAKLAESTQPLTLANITAKNDEQVTGTPYYIAPEVLLAQPTDHRVDIYGLGVVMYELSTGRRPFSQQNLFALLYNVAYASLVPPSIANHAADLSEAAEGVILAAMARDPAARPATASLLGQALEASLQASLPAASAPEEAPRRPQPALAIGLEETMLQVDIKPITGAAPRPPAPDPMPVEALRPTPTMTAEAVLPAAVTPVLPAAPASMPGMSLGGASMVGPVPETTIPQGSVHRGWKMGVLGLGIGGAVALGAVKLLSPEPPAPPTTPVQTAPTATTSPPPGEPGVKPPPVPPPDPVAHLHELHDSRVRELQAALAARKAAQVECLKKKTIMVGTRYVLPVIVDVAADGRATAVFDAAFVITDGLLLPTKVHSCILGLIKAERYTTADEAVQVRFVAPID